MICEWLKQTKEQAKDKNVRNTIAGKLSLFCNFKTLNKNLRNDKMD